MTDDDRLLLNDLKTNTQRLFAEFNAKVAESKMLKDNILALKKEIEVLKQEKFNLSRKYENLKLAKQMVLNDDDKSEARQRINKLVREIDKCIALLNK